MHDNKAHKNSARSYLCQPRTLVCTASGVAFGFLNLKTTAASRFDIRWRRGNTWISALHGREACSGCL